MKRSPDRLQEDAAHTPEGFLQRWSRRKRDARAAPEAPVPSGADALAPVEASIPDVAPDPAASAPAEPPGDADMPALESLGAGSDVSAFFSPRVSESLRRAALRRIFHAPESNVTDGLDPYLTDFRNLKPLGNVVTSDMRLALERARERMAHLTAAKPDQTVAATAPTAAAEAAKTTDTPPTDAADPAGDSHGDT